MAAPLRQTVSRFFPCISVVSPVSWALLPTAAFVLLTPIPHPCLIRLHRGLAALPQLCLTPGRGRPAIPARGTGAALPSPSSRRTLESDPETRRDSGESDRKGICQCSLSCKHRAVSGESCLPLRTASEVNRQFLRLTTLTLQGSNSS